MSRKDIYWKPLFEGDFRKNSTKTIRLFALDFYLNNRVFLSRNYLNNSVFMSRNYLNNRVFLSRNYWLIVARGNLMFLNKYLPEKRSFEGKYASFKNIKFPRDNYQTDS